MFREIVHTSLRLYQAVWTMQTSQERFNMGLHAIVFCEELRRVSSRDHGLRMAIEIIRRKRFHVLEAGPLKALALHDRLGFVHPAMNMLIERFGQISVPDVDLKRAKMAIRCMKSISRYEPDLHVLLWSRMHDVGVLSKDLYENILKAYPAAYANTLNHSLQSKSNPDGVVWFALERQCLLSLSALERWHIVEAAISWFRFWLFSTQLPPVTNLGGRILQSSSLLEALREDLTVCTREHIPTLQERISYNALFPDATFIASIWLDLRRLALFAEYLKCTIDAANFFKALDGSDIRTLLIELDGLYGQFVHLVEQISR